MRLALFAQLFYAALVVLWQLVGAGLIALGEAPLGPMASLTLAGQAIVIAALYVFALRRSPLLFVWMTIATAVLAALVIWSSFTADPALWRSDGTRYLSLAVNSVGIFALVFSVKGYLKWRAGRCSDLRARETPR